MILNERQYRISKAAEARVAKRIDDFERRGAPELQPKQRELLVKAAKEQLAEIRRELEEFDALKKGAIAITPISSIEDLPLAVIRARIARGWTQAKLADELDVAEQQVQRDESNAYRGASVERLHKVADVMGVRVGGIAAIGPAESSRAVDTRWRKPLLVMLLRALRQIHGRGLEGRLELQKLVIVLEERLRAALDLSAFRFEPYLFGGYDFEIDDDLDFLAHHHFIALEVPAARKGRADPVVETREPVRIGLGPKGEEWLERFLMTDQLTRVERKQAVYGVVTDVVQEYGSIGARALVEHTYEHHEDLSSRSMIREDVERRVTRKRKKK